VILGVAFLYYWPTAMALVSRAAPPALKSTLMGLLFMSFFVSDIALGWIGVFYDTMSPAAFWGLHAAIAAAGAVLSMLLARPLNRILGS
jgi:POT family proton-dependent oligopeptide transporter